MITLTREEAQQVTDRELIAQAIVALEYHTYQTRPIPNTNLAIEALRARLAQPELVRVSPQEFVRAVESKENLVGIPVMWTEWPTKENA
jgi:hypothetical protein